MRWWFALVVLTAGCRLCLTNSPDGPGNAFEVTDVLYVIVNVEKQKITYALNVGEQRDLLTERLKLYERALRADSFEQIISSGLLRKICFDNDMFCDEIMQNRPRDKTSAEVTSQFHEFIQHAIQNTQKLLPQTDSPSASLQEETTAKPSRSSSSTLIEHSSGDEVTNLPDFTPKITKTSTFLIPGKRRLDKLTYNSSGWILHPKTGCRYMRVFRPRRAWSAAEAVCKRAGEGTTLAEPKSEADARFLASLAVQPGALGRPQWVNGVHVVSAKQERKSTIVRCVFKKKCKPFAAPCAKPGRCTSTWKWSSGEVINSSLFYPGEPSARGHEDQFCLQLGYKSVQQSHENWRLADENCVIRAEFTCQWCPS